MAFLGRIISYTCTAVALMMGIDLFSDNLLLPSIPMFLAALIVAPPIRELLQSKISPSFTPGGCFAMFCALFIIGIVLLSLRPSSLVGLQAEIANDAPHEAVPFYNSDNSAKAQYLAVIESYLWELENFKISDIHDGTTIESTLFKIASYARVYYEGERYELTPTEKNLLSKYKLQLIAFQKKAFPKMRDVYGPVVREKGWEYNIEGRTFGDGYRTLEISGYHFITNQNIKVVMESISPLVNSLRFKKVRFKWAKSADEYTYYDIKSLNDAEIASE